MNRKTVRITACLIAIAMVLGVFALGISYVFAENEQAQINASQQKVNEQQKKLDEINKKKKLTASDIENLKKETVAIQSQIDSKNTEIAKTDKELKKAEAELDKAKKRSQAQYDAYKERFRVMCESGPASYLEVILSSDSIMDFVSNIETAKEISEYDKKIYDEMKASEEKIQKLADEISSSKKKLETEKSALAQQKSNLNAKQSQLEEVKKTLQQDSDAAQKIIDEEIRKQNALKAQIAGKLSNSGSSVYSGGAFVWPTPSCTYITSPFSPARVNPVSGKLRPHTGTDIGAQYGASVIAAASGNVIFSGWNGGYGNCVIIDHGGGRSTLYGHMSSIAVSVGQSVSAGQLVGKVGSTGNSTGPHLHFEVMINGAAVDPMQYF